MNKLILRTSLTTLFVLFVIFGYGTAAFSFLFPRTMANFCDTLGAYDAAAMHYEREYNANPTSENLYTVLDKYIAAQNYQKIVKYADKFLACEKYDEIIKTVNQSGVSTARDKYEYINRTNEDNRIKCNFATALIKTGKAARAESELAKWLTLPINQQDREQPNYAFFSFVVEGKADAVQTLFESYYNEFKVGYDNTSLHQLDFLIWGGRYLSVNTETYTQQFDAISFLN